jgi:type II restriction enzyme
MSDTKQRIDNLITRIEKGEIDPKEAWDKIKELKEEYVQHYSEQSWHVYIGNKFQGVVYSILKGYLHKLRSQNSQFANLNIFTESEVKSNDIIVRKLAVKYGEYLLLPDTDIVIVDYKFTDPWKSEVLAIVSCKTSLRERIAQACYWKLKLLSSDVTKNTRVFLATTDNDEDFFIRNKVNYGGKSRNRIIAEYELDGVYILREDFKKEWESSKVKRYERIFDDLVKIFKGN